VFYTLDALPDAQRECQSTDKCTYKSYFSDSEAMTTKQETNAKEEKK